MGEKVIMCEDFYMAILGKLFREPIVAVFLILGLFFKYTELIL